MPELPEVETTVRGLNKRVLGRTFIDVWSDWKKMVKKPGDFETFRKEIRGKKIKKIWRRAKNIIFDLSPANFESKNKDKLSAGHKIPKLVGDKSEGYSLLVHQKMTGHLIVGKWRTENGKWVPIKKGPLGEKINTFLRLIFFLDNGEMIALSDLRKFAKAELWKTEDLLRSTEFGKLGPEPLDKSFTFVKFTQLFERKKGKIKQVIMNPEFIAGIGNIYSSEALWRAKVHPLKDASKLTKKELKALYDSIRKVLLLGIKLGGESFSDYRNIEGKKGRFDPERKVYQREKERCAKCKTPIRRLKIGGRSAFFCPACQQLKNVGRPTSHN